MAKAGMNVANQFVWNLVGSHTQNTSLSGVVSVTVPDGANAVLLTARTQNVCYTLDGTAPTASKGLLLKAGDSTVMVPCNPGSTLKFIEETTSAKLDYQFIAMGS